MGKACGIPLPTQKNYGDKYQNHAGTEESKLNLGQVINHKRMCSITLSPDAKLQLVECIVRMQEVDIDLNASSIGHFASDWRRTCPSID
jgi:hypothetical protein